MKTIALVTALLLGLNGLYAQEKDKPRASPLMKTEAIVGDVKINIQYGSPSVKGRIIFGDLVPYGKVWRTGANEASVFEINKDIQVEGKTLKAGKYGLFTIPGKDKWVIIFNSAWSIWGAYDYKEKKDVLRVEVKPTMVPDDAEKFTIYVEDGTMYLHWANTKVPVALK
ncbi:MAG: hypothetical protein CL840_02355 [Crocinitomicaceae bacterium]|nr:hypothetical protein [Crocinitomicaceae bacterium]|tara:strand:- start:1899 stop:2405 length:507 start_codon:yes stop_codon:yes gene_type:complete